MTGVTDAGSIRLLLAGPAVLRTFALALLGRLAYGVLPLCFLFTVRDATGSFAVAAASSAVLGFAALAMPIQARLVDRYGQRRVLPVYTACYVSLLATGAVLAQGVHPGPVWLGLGLLLGVTSPALGPAMRAQWREIAPDGPLRRRAYSLDSVGEESLYLVGPIIAGAALAAGPAWVGLLLTGGLLACGTTALVTSPYHPSAGAAAAVRSAGPATGPLRRGRLLGLLSALALFGAGGAAALVGIAALADHAGRPGAAGVIEAIMATGAVLGGLLWARWGRTPPANQILAALLIGLAVTQAVAAGAAQHLMLVGPVLALGALATSPVFVVAFSTADRLVPERQRTEASTWVNVSVNAGTAAGTATAGLTTGISGGAPFLLASALTACAALAACSRNTTRAFQRCSEHDSADRNRD